MLVGISCPESPDAAAILWPFQGLVKVRDYQLFSAKTGQHKPLMTATGCTIRTLSAVDGPGAASYPVGHAERERLRTKGPRAVGGAWEAVRVEVTGWPGFRVRRRFGRDGLWLRGRLFAYGPGAGDDVWVRLTLPVQRLALRETGILPHPRFARTGWVVVRLRGASGRSLARRWLARAYAAARAVPPETA